MKNQVITGVLLATGMSCAAAAFAAEAPVTRVILSTSGLAHFERRAEVTGDAALQFPVRLEQVDDILKSLVVFDAKGTLGGVTLPGKQPLEQVFKDLPFTREQLAQPMLLLNAYQGADMTVKGPGTEVSGKIVSVTPEVTVTKDGAQVVRHRLSLMTDAGLADAVLEDMTSIQFRDAALRDEINRALDAVRANGTADMRTMTVSLNGAGKRDVRFSYVVDAPLWKAAYRMVVPETGKDKGLLQGWAVIENMTASDWDDVDLTLVSGNPVTYRQSLYESYYVERPEIPVQVFGRVMPRVDEGALATADMMESDAMYAPQKSLKEAHGGGASFNAYRDAPAAEMAMAAPAPAMEMYAARTGIGTVAQVANAAQSAEATTQVLFRFPATFDLKAGQSLMLPFVSREVPMRRVSLYQPDTHATHPLAAVELENDGDTGLPPGILTLYEESAALEGTAFVGDAQLPVLAQDEKRMVSYALDSKTQISREMKSTTTDDRIAVDGGVMRISVVQRSETTYTVKAPAGEDRTVILEHNKMGDYKITSPAPEDVDVTDTHYRIRVEVKAGETKTVPVVLERQMWQSWNIDSMPVDRLMAYASSRGDLDPVLRRTFEDLAAARREIDAINRDIYTLDRQKMEIFQDQERLRENLKSLTGKSDVKERYLDKLEEQEKALAQIDERKQELEGQRADKTKQLQKMIEKVAF